MAYALPNHITIATVAGQVGILVDLQMDSGYEPMLKRAVHSPKDKKV